MRQVVHRQIFTQKLEGTKRKERPRKGWREVERDLQVLGVRRWRELVTDRTEWRDIVRQAKTTTGCSANGRRRRRILDFKLSPCSVCCMFSSG
jgi:hypothetical protein